MRNMISADETDGRATDAVVQVGGPADPAPPPNPGYAPNTALHAPGRNKR